MESLHMLPVATNGHYILVCLKFIRGGKTHAKTKFGLGCMGVAPQDF